MDGRWREIKTLELEADNAELNCNDKILRGVIFQRELKEALDGKIQVNTEIIEEKKPLLKEQEKLQQAQKKTIQELKQLNDRL